MRRRPRQDVAAGVWGEGSPQRWGFGGERSPPSGGCTGGSEPPCIRFGFRAACRAERVRCGQRSLVVWLGCRAFRAAVVGCEGFVCLGGGNPEHTRCAIAN